MMRPCLDCGRPSHGARCPDHERVQNQRRHEKAKANGLYSLHWRNLRDAVFMRSAGLCELRIDDDCRSIMETVHLDPALEGDHLAATPEDCKAACLHCHGVVDAPRARSVA